MIRPDRSHHRPRAVRRGSTLMLVLWIVTIASLIVIPLQLSAQRQAMAGRESLGRVRAKWAARSGVEAYMAFLEWQIDTEQETDPARFKDDMEQLAHGEIRDVNGVLVSEYHIQHWFDDELRDAPADAHAKANINTLTEESLAKLEDITPEMVASILDWIDADSDVREGGAEAGYYNNALKPYNPRNGPFKTVQELELVYGVTPKLVRGEDWNLNGILDPNEDDGSDTPPDDNADGRLDAGWSALLTAASREPGPLVEAPGRISLSTSAVSAIAMALGVDSNQANALFHYSRAEGNTLEGLITTPLSTITQSGQPAAPGGVGPTGGTGATGGTGRGGGAGRGQPQPQQPQQQALGARDLTDEQLGKALSQATIGTTYASKPGRLNINTAPVKVLELLPGVDEALADQIDLLRNSRTDGLTGIIELLQIPTLSRETLAAMAPFIDVKSNVFVLTSRGVALPGRTEVELVVTIDRSSLPIRILDYLER